MVASVSSSTLFSESLTELSAVASENLDRWNQVKQRSEELLEALADGRGVADLVRRESPPRIVELVTQNIVALESAGAKVRRTEAAALREEGLTLAEIGVLFGVSRQRIAELLS